MTDQTEITCLNRGLCYDFQGRNNPAFSTHHVSISQNDPNIICCANGGGGGGGDITLQNLIFNTELGFNVSPNAANTVTVSGDGGVVTVGVSNEEISFRDLRNWTPFVVGLNPQVSSEYSSIQSAINDASAAAISSGVAQLVLIQAGTYTEVLTLADNVSLRGVARGDVTIVGSVNIPLAVVTSCQIQQLTINGDLNVEGILQVDNVIINGSIVSNLSGPGRGCILTLLNVEMTGDTIDFTNGGLLTSYNSILTTISTVFGASGLGVATVRLYSTQFLGLITITNNSSLQAFGSSFLTNINSQVFNINSPMSSGVFYLLSCHVGGDVIMTDTTATRQGITFEGCIFENPTNIPSPPGSEQCIISANQATIATFIGCYMIAQFDLSGTAQIWFLDSYVASINSGGALNTTFDINQTAVDATEIQGVHIHNSYIRGRIFVSTGNLTMSHTYIDHTDDAAIRFDGTVSCIANIYQNTFYTTSSSNPGTPAITGTQITNVPIICFKNSFKSLPVQVAGTFAVSIGGGNQTNSDGFNSAVNYTGVFANAPSNPLTVTVG